MKAEWGNELWWPIQPAKVIWKPGSSETIETSWLAAVILFLEDWLTLQQLSVFLQEKVWGKSIVFSYWGILLSCLWSSGFWGLLPSKSLFHFSELQCGLALAGLFFRELLNPAFTRAYPNVMRLVPDQDWSFQSQQLRSYFMYILKLDSGFVSQTFWAEFQCVCRIPPLLK